MEDRDSARHALSERGVPFDAARLVAAVRSGDLTIVELLLAAGIAPSIRSDDGEPVVVMAARLGHQEVARALLRAGADCSGLLEAVSQQRKRRDIWERLGSLTGVFTFASSLIIAAIGWYFTSTYNDRQLRQDRSLRSQQNRVLEMQTVERMIPHLAGTEQSKKVALLVISRLARPELATGMAELVGGEGAIAAAKTIAVTGQSEDKTFAVSALTGIATTGAGIDATAARDALGVVFKGRGKGLVKILHEDTVVCSGFLVDATKGWFATAGYCMDRALSSGGGAYLETAEGKRVPVKQVVPQPPKEDDFFRDPVVMVQADATGLVPLPLAARSPELGNRVVGIGFASGQLVAAVGVVNQLDVSLPGSSDRFVGVKLEGARTSGMGTGGGPFLDNEGSVACMIFVGNETTDQCVPADAIRRALSIAQRS